ncbi:hypothetical protein HPB49_004437 [Dermacentor silvarum]|uniref:Uncharacterized protein n=1 Tax=Dermacentor silvarum TaxID=543639 RepID=A0ACB8DUY9_DERSI|nr:hypothetical protein HPB49_004437 [Dermacentor silvarum]
MADSVALYSIIDNDVLISCVEIRPELWQPRHKDHKNRFKKAVLWSEVAAAVLPNVSGAEVIVQKRWKSLRDNFRKVTKVHKDSQKSGAGADDAEDSLPDNVWLYSDQLRFLKDTVEGRATSGNLDDGKSAQELFHTMTRPRSITPPGSPVQENADIEDLFALEDDVDVSQPSTSSRQSTTLETAGQDPLSRKPQVQSETNGQRSRKRKGDPLQQEIDDVSQRLAKHKPPDEDEYFALSLVPTMREFPKHKRLRMRIEVLELLEALKQAC